MTRNKRLLKCRNRAIRETFLAKQMKKRTKIKKNGPSSSGCFDHLKKQPQKKIENSYRCKWLRYENDLMFCDTCLTAMALVLPSKI